MPPVQPAGQPNYNTGHDPNLSRGGPSSPARIRISVPAASVAAAAAPTYQYQPPPPAQPYSAAYSSLSAAAFNNPSASPTTYHSPGFSGPKQNQDLVRFKPLPYYDDYIKVVRVKATEAPAKGYYIRFEFTFDGDQSARLTYSGKHDPASGTTYPTYRVLYMMTSFEAATSVRLNEPTGPGSGIEYPPYPQLVVNNNQVQPRFAGLKNKPYTAYPADVTKYVDRRKGMMNRVEFRYQNTLKVGNAVPLFCSDPSLTLSTFSPQKYVGAVVLARKVPIPTIVSTLREKRSISKDHVISSRRKQMAEDDDIVATTEIISLKDPISKLRVKDAVRPETCHHMQCFDATTFLEMNETSPNFTCPVCHKPFDWDSVVLDGYFDDILANSPPQVDSVEVDPETFTWKVREEDKEEDFSDDDSDAEMAPKVEEKKLEVVDLDDEEPAPTQRRSLPPPPPKRQSNVIDLTLDSDEDEPMPAAPARSGSSAAVQPAAAPQIPNGPSTASTYLLPTVVPAAPQMRPSGAPPTLRVFSSSLQPRFGEPTGPVAVAAGQQPLPQVGPALGFNAGAPAGDPQQFSDPLPSELEEALYRMPDPPVGGITSGVQSYGLGDQVFGHGIESADAQGEDLNALLQRIRDTFEGAPLDGDDGWDGLQVS